MERIFRQDLSREKEKGLKEIRGDQTNTVFTDSGAHSGKAEFSASDLETKYNHS